MARTATATPLSGQPDAAVIVDHSPKQQVGALGSTIPDGVFSPVAEATHGGTRFAPESSR